MRSNLRGHVVHLLAAVGLIPACVELSTHEESAAQSASSSEATVEIARPLTAADVVLDLAESATGWSTTSGNTLSVSTTRQQGAGSLSSVGSAVDRFRRTNIGPVDARNMQYLTFWYFIDDASKIIASRDA